MSKRKKNYSEFWPFYLREHSKAETRYLHYVGTSLVIMIGIFLLVTQRWGLIPLLPVPGYFFAWVAHFLVEKNKPATFTHPLWSLISDFRMYFLWVTGKLEPELNKAGVTNVTREQLVVEKESTSPTCNIGSMESK